MSLSRIKIFLYHLYITSFIVSFYIPSLYQIIVYAQFVVLIIILCVYSRKNILDHILILWLFYTLIFTLLGLPGSAFGYLSSAIIGLFSSNYFTKYNKTDVDRSTISFIVVALAYIISSLFVLNLDLNIGEQASYFGIASINYAGLTIGAFSLIFTTYCVQYKYSRDVETWPMEAPTRILALLLAFCVAGVAFTYDIRSILFTILPPLIYALKLNRRKLLILTIFLLGITIIYYDFINQKLLEFIVPGREELGNLYESELSSDSERLSVIMNTIETILPRFGLCFNCSDYMSYSGLINLITLSFPFSLYIMYTISKFIMLLGRGLIGFIKVPATLTLTLIVIFTCSLIQVLLQADFLSITAFFYVIGTGTALFTTKRRKHLQRLSCKIKLSQ